MYKFNFDDEVKRYVEKELNETPKNREEGFKAIKEWLEENRHLNAKDSEYDILPFLRVCKFDVEKTKSKIENFYKMRRNVKEWYTNRDPLSKNIHELIVSGNFLPLKQTIDKKMVIIVRTAAHDPKQFDINDVIKTSIMIFDVIYQDYELAHIYGVIILLDMQGTSIDHFKQISSVGFIKNCVRALKHFYCRPKLMVFFNVPTFLNILLNLFKRLLPSKINERVNVFNQGAEILDELIDTDILPQEYGGKGDSLKDLSEHWMEIMKNKREWFAEDEKHKAD